MKNSKIYLLLILAIALSSCSRMNFDVAKRKYRSGYYVEMSSYEKEKNQIVNAFTQPFNKQLQKAKDEIPASVNFLERKLTMLYDEKNDVSFTPIPRKIIAQNTASKPSVFPSTSVIENSSSQLKNITKDEFQTKGYGNGEFRFLAFLTALLLLILIFWLLVYFIGSWLLGFIVFILLLFIIFHFFGGHHHGGGGY